MRIMISSCRISIPLLVLLGVLFCPPLSTAQTVSHPVSELSSTVKYYAYRHVLNATQYKDIEYIIVKASNGDVKTVFNACDVCYASYKGYSQAGTQVRCNNCGNRFPIDGLGNQNTGGTCNPGYLPHVIQGDQVVLAVSDLVKGAYFFATRTKTGIDDVVENPGLMLATGRQYLTVSLPGDGRRTFQVFSLGGLHLQTLTASSRTVLIDISHLAAGPYVLAVQEGRTMTAKPFLVY